MTANSTTVESVYDPELALRLTGQQSDLAADMLAGLLRTLPIALTDIYSAAEQQDFTTLKKTLHKLRGLICYCGVPRLNRAVIALETAIKENKPIAEFIRLLSEESAALKKFSVTAD